MSITNLKNINSDELKTLLEKNGIEIKKTSNKNYIYLIILLTIFICYNK